MFRVVFSGETAIAAVKGLYAWLAENQSLATSVSDIVINRQPKVWEAVVYVSVVAKG